MSNWHRARRRLAVLFIGLSLLASAYALRGYYLPALAHWLDVGERPVPVDFAIVLPGDVNSRPFVAAALYKAGLARRIATTSPTQSPEVKDGVVPAETVLIRRTLLALGVPADDIVILDGDSQSTFDDARCVAKLLEKQPRVSIAVVTNQYHTRRSRWVFHHVLAGLPIEIHMVSVPTDYFNADNWWRDQSGFTIYCTEYVKFAFYVLWYGAAGWWIASAMGLALTAWLIRRYWSARGSSVWPQ